MDFYSKEIQIIRQSQIKFALDYSCSLNIHLTIEELQRFADVLVECCMRPQDDDLKKRIKALDKWILDKKTNESGRN